MPFSLIRRLYLQETESGDPGSGSVQGVTTNATEEVTQEEATKETVTNTTEPTPEEPKTPKQDTPSKDQGVDIDKAINSALEPLKKLLEMKDVKDKALYEMLVSEKVDRLIDAAKVPDEIKPLLASKTPEEVSTYLQSPEYKAIKLVYETANQKQETAKQTQEQAKTIHQPKTQDAPPEPEVKSPNEVKPKSWDSITDKDLNALGSMLAKEF